MSTLPPELANLPAPSLVEPVSYEARLAERRSRLTALFAQAGINYVPNPDADPAQIQLQEAAYDDVLLRQRINEAVLSYFLAFATGSDVDALAQWYDVSRLTGENDDRLKRRIVLAIKGRSPGGTEERYQFIALTADIRVADAKPYTIGRNPTIHVAVFSTDNGGVASAALLAKVDSALQASTVRLVNDTIVVASAAQQVLDVAAHYWLLPGAPESVGAQMQANLRALWSREMMLGRDPTRSWLLSALQIDGVQRVELVGWTDVEVPFNRAAALGAVFLTKMGRAY